LTCNKKESPFYKSKPGLRLSENQTLQKSPSTLYDFDMMSTARPKEVASGGDIIEIFVRPTSTPEKSSDENEKSDVSSPLSSPTSFVPIKDPNRFMSDWEKIKANTPKVTIPPID